MTLMWEGLCPDARREQVAIADRKYALLMQGVRLEELDRLIAAEEKAKQPKTLGNKQVMQLLGVKTTRRLANLRRQGLPAEQVSYVWHYDLELVLDWASMMGWEINPDGLKACRRALA